MLKKIKNNSFKSSLLKLLIFFSVIFFLDLIIGTAFKIFYFKQKSGFDHLTTYALEETKADILIFGSSRAVNILNPDAYEKELGLSCYNVGRYGEPIFYHYAVLRSVLKRHTPKIIILSFDARNFSLKQEAYDQLAVLLPYYHSHPELRSIAELKGPHEKLKLVSVMYPYNSLLLPLIGSNSDVSQKINRQSKGFIPLKRSFVGPLKTVNYSTEKVLDSIKINAYKSFIRDCINSNIELYIVCPPYLENSIGIDHSIFEGQKIAQEYKINFFDYSTDTFFTNRKELFDDFRHLNEKGSEILSSDVIKRIKATAVVKQ